VQSPILLLTAKSRVLDKAEGLNAGADDYLVKPFAFVELIARVRALLRRSPKVEQAELSYDTLRLDCATMTAYRSGTPISLTAKEYALLDYFMRNTDRVLKKQQIIDHVWDYQADILPNTVEVYVGSLRQKIDTAFTDHTALLHTKRGFGYIFGKARA